MPTEPLLAKRLHAALGLDGPVPDDTHPLAFYLEQQKYLAYVWTCTPDKSAPGERPAGEHKIQLTLPGQKKGERGFLHFEPDACTALLGYCPDLGLYVGWEAKKHPDFSHSSNVQVPEEVLQRAQVLGWACDLRPLPKKRTTEVRVAVAPWNLRHLLESLALADADALDGEDRLHFFEGSRPQGHPDQEPLPKEPKERLRVMATRLERDRRFAQAVKAEFDQACVICGWQLGVVQAAHIIPASLPDGVDEAWNGLAMCPTHHTLYDSHLMLVDSGLTITVDGDRLKMLRQSNLGGGSAEVEALDGRRISKPESWEDDDFRKQMRAALTRRTKLAQGG
jgi:putative restriction endonuclease